MGRRVGRMLLENKYFYKHVCLVCMPDLENILEIAVRAEIDAAQNYRKAAKQTAIYLLKEKFGFLENEERGHQQLLETLFKKKFPERKITLPEENEMPFPPFTVTDDMQLSEILKRAMEAEKMAAAFYKEMKKHLSGEEEKAMARYLSSMEESHYYLLKSELEIAYNFELYDEVHAMMHVGP